MLIIASRLMSWRIEQRWECVIVLNLWKRQLRWCLSMTGIRIAPENHSGGVLKNHRLPGRLILAAGIVLLFSSSLAAQDTARQAKIDQILSANPGLRFEPKAGKFFRLQQSAVSWTVAERDARDPAKHSINGVAGRLGTIRSIEENTLVTEMAKPAFSYVWLSASDAHAEGNFRWYRSGAAADAITYSNWAPGQPFDYNGTMDSLRLTWWGQWYSYWDNTPNSYLVEWSADELVAADPAAQAPKALST
ncbi:MAG: lectin-like protein, partial [Phycisphaerae bacterium]